MPRPTETALKSRARRLLEAMTERARWVYAVPRDPGAAAARAVALDAGLTCVEDDAASGKARFADAAGTAALSIIDSPDLEVTLIEASGEGAPPVLGKILDQTGFYAQSTLLGTALDLRDEEASQALETLAHMVVAWDKDFADLFALHIGAPDAETRRGAAEALAIAVKTAGDAGPARRLLEAAIAREADAEVAEAMTRALAALTA